MQVEQAVSDPTFSGTKNQKALAEKIFRAFLIQGRFFSDQAPIRITLDQLTEFMSQQDPDTSNWASQIDKALSANADIFAREEEDGRVTFITTRKGHPPTDLPSTDVKQTLTRRFTTPEPKRAIPRSRRTARPSSLIADERGAAADAMLEWQDVTPQEVRDAQAAAQDVAPSASVEVVEEEVQAPARRPAASEAVSAAADVATASDEELANAIRSSLAHEMSVARWGDLWMNEDRVRRFSRGELRRIEDLLRDQNGIATDEEIVTDIFGIRPGTPEFDTTRFAVNYRLSREAREFEYVGTDTAGVWTLANQPIIGTTKRKPGEIGQDYRFLLDYLTPDEGIEEGLIEHVLSFYEYEHGVLPLDANLATIMPRPGFPEQRAARLTFESPQTTETVVAELRFATGNRGGFIAGLEEFFAENLVPGAVITIESTDRPDHFLLEYFRVSGEDRKLLHFDERKGKYTFRSTTYYCATQDEFVISEGRFPKLADAKPLEDRVRRRPEQVVAATFERVGENLGSADEPRYSASLSDLLVAANIERPIAIELLRDILTSGTYQEFSADEGNEDVFFYQPGA